MPCHEKARLKLLLFLFVLCDVRLLVLILFLCWSMGFEVSEVSLGTSVLLGVEDDRDAHCERLLLPLNTVSYIVSYHLAPHNLSSV